MTNEELQAHIDALNKAAADGEIQGRPSWNHDQWFQLDSPLLSPGGYRIKPAPREVYGIEDSRGDVNRLYFSKGHMATCGEGRVVTFREVLE